MSDDVETKTADPRGTWSLLTDRRKGDGQGGTIWRLPMRATATASGQFCWATIVGPVYTPQPPGFANDPTYVFPADVYRREVKKLVHAQEALARLGEEVEAWGKRATIRFLMHNPADAPTDLQLDAHIDPLPPVEDWWMDARVAFADLREALEQLNHKIHIHINGTEPSRNARFPMTQNPQQWEGWRRSAGAAHYPSWLIERYEAFQPHLTKRPLFTYLEQIVNEEKHRSGVLAAFSLDSLRLEESEIAIEPMVPDDFDSSRILASYPERVTLAAAINPIHRLHLDGHRLSVGEPEQSGRWHYQLTIRVGGEEIPLAAAASMISHEVLWAFQHVIGRERDAARPPRHFDLSIE